MFCPYCGKELPEGSAFCNGCGAKLTAGAPVANPVNQKPQGYTTGTKIWLGFCTVMNLIVGVSTLIVGFSFSSVTVILAALINVCIGVAYWCLWIKKRKDAFYVIVGLCILSFVMTIAQGTGAIVALTSFVNPLITYLVIRKYYFKQGV